jgi:AraC family transcriptional regulator
MWPNDFEIFADMLDILAVAPLHDVKPAAGARINLGAYDLSLRRRKQPFARGPRIEPGIEDALRRGRRAWSRRMSFIPAGHRFYGWQKPRALTRSTFLYIDPLSPLLGSELHFSEVEFRPRLFFFDLDIWETALKLKAQLQNSCRSQKAYVEALGIALAHELTRMNEDTPSLASDARGGLPHWQQKKLTQYIEEHLADEVSLLSLAQLAQLSPYHFSRAFKQSFGMPPHQYLTRVQTH